MLLTVNNRLLIAAFALLLLSGIATIVLNNYWWLLLPAVFISIFFLMQYTVTKTEIFFYGLIFLLPLSTELNITPALGLDFPDEPLMLLLTGLFFLKIIYQPAYFPKSILKHPLFFLVLIHLLWIFITCIFSSNPLISFKFFAAKIWYIIPFTVMPFLIFTSQKKIIQFALLLLMPMLFVAIQCLVRHSFYGFSFDEIKATLSPFFRNHVNYSGMLVCMLPVLYCIIKLTVKYKASYKFLILAFIILLVALVLSYSRGAWLALIVGIAVSYIIKKRKIVIAIFAVFIFLSVSITWLSYNKHYLKFAPEYNTTIFHTNFEDHLKATVTLKDVSNAERFYRWVAAVNMIKANPIVGSGPNTFYSQYKNYSESIFKTWVSTNKDHSSVHNYFLLIGLEQGIVGLLLFTVLLIAMLLQTEKLYHQLQNNFYKQIALATGVIIAMIAVLNFLSDLIETDKIGSLFWLCLGMIFILTKKLNEEKQVTA